MLLNLLVFDASYIWFHVPYPPYIYMGYWGVVAKISLVNPCLRANSSAIHSHRNTTQTLKYIRVWIHLAKVLGVISLKKPPQEALEFLAQPSFNFVSMADTIVGDHMT